MPHVQDRWEKTVNGRSVRTDRYGNAKRWQARYHDPDGRERTKDFDRKQDAECFLSTVTADVLRGASVDPNAGKVTFAEFAERWLTAQTFSESSMEATSYSGLVSLKAVASSTGTSGTGRRRRGTQSRVVRE